MAGLNGRKAITAAATAPMIAFFGIAIARSYLAKARGIEHTQYAYN
jgi:hypothetical protein